MIATQENRSRVTATGEPVISKYLHSRGVALGLPISGTFELTRRCNFSCRMCYVHNEHCVKDALSTEDWLNIAGQAVDAGVLFLLLTGGEPFIREDFCDIYSALSKMGFVISINTNAFLYGGKIRELLKKNKPSRINVSLYGTSDGQYTALTGVPAFETVKKNILLMKEDGIPVRLNCSFTPYNADSMEEIHRFAEENDLFIKATTYMYPQTRSQGAFGENDGRFTPEQAAAGRLKYDLIHYGREEFVRRFEAMRQGVAECENDCIDQSEGGDGVRCRAGRSAFWIDASGNMSACGMFDGKHSVPEEGFLSAWQNVIKETSEIKLPPECKTCKYRHFCNVCAAVCYCESGDFGRLPSYVCEMSRLTYLGTGLEKNGL